MKTIAVAFLLPVATFTPEQLLTGRDVPFDCKDKTCTIARDDLQWIVARSELLLQLTQHFQERASKCFARDV